MAAQHSVLYLSLTNTLTLASHWTPCCMSFNLAVSGVVIFPGCLCLGQRHLWARGEDSQPVLQILNFFLSQIVYPFF